MTIHSGPNPVETELLINIDISNSAKNSGSLPSTNFIRNGAFFNGAGVVGESGSYPTNTIVLVENPGDSPYVLQQNGNYAEYQLNLTTEMVPSTQYVMSGWYAKSSNYDGIDTMFHSRAFSTSGAHVSTAVGIGTLIYSRVINGITWEYRYQTITTPADYNNVFNWYVGYGTNNTTGFRYYTNLKVEKGSYPSLLDLSGNKNNTTSDGSLSYSSSNSGFLSFNGTSICETSSDISFGNNTTWEAWIRCTQSINTYNMFLGRHLPYFCFYSGNRLMFSNTINSVQQSLYGDANLSLNTWYQAVATTQYDGVNTITKLYVNGVQSGSTGTFAGAQSNFSTRFSIGDGHSKVQYPASTPWYPFKGDIGIVRVYNKTLSQSEIVQNFNATRGRYGI